MNLLNSSIERSLRLLRSGGIILYPTDTVWGIGCDATNEEAIDRIFKLKQRADSKSMIILVADEQAILKFTASPNPAIFNLLAESDRPTTVIYENALGLPDNLVNADGSIAIRIVKEPFCKAIIKRLGNPLVSTSANISGKPTPHFFSEISDKIKEGVDYIPNYRRDDRSPASPSKIIKLESTGEINVIRE